MTQLKDLLSSIPEPVLHDYARYQRKKVMREVSRRQASSYARRLEELGEVFHPFDQCRQNRPQKGKYKNHYSREEAGTAGNITIGIRTGAYSVCVCKSRIKQ